MNIGWQRREQAAPAPKAEATEVPPVGANLPEEIRRVRTAAEVLAIPGALRAVTVLATGLASMPMHYQKRDDEHGGNYSDYMRGYGKYMNYLMRGKPNPIMTAHDFVLKSAIDIIMQGNAVWYNQRSRGLETQALYLCSSANVNPLTMEYLITFQAEDGEHTLNVPMSEVIHHKSPFTRMNGLVGIGFPDLAADALSLSATNDNRAMRVAANGGDMKYLVSEDNKNPQVGATRRLTKEQKETQHNSIQNQLSEGNNVILVSGLMDVKPITDPGSTQVLLDTRKFDVVRIAQIFGVPPILLMDYTNNTYKAPEQALHELHRTLLPFKLAIENELNAKLIGFEGFESMRFWMDDEVFMAIDPKARAEMAKIYIETGIWCPNEARHAMNLPALKKEEGGDQHLVSTNLQKLDDIKLGKNQAQPASNDNDNANANKEEDE